MILKFVLAIFVILFVFVWLSSIVAGVFVLVVLCYTLTIMLAGMPVCSMAGVRFRVVGWLAGWLAGWNNYLPFFYCFCFSICLAPDRASIIIHCFFRFRRVLFLLVYIS